MKYNTDLGDEDILENVKEIFPISGEFRCRYCRPKYSQHRRKRRRRRRKNKEGEGREENYERQGECGFLHVLQVTARGRKTFPD
jgi:hypothetical protein